MIKNLVKSFRAITYNTKLFKSPGEFLALPYDIIDKKLQNEFYKRSKYNVIRLILGKEYKNDDENNNKYTRARKYLEQWLEKGILVQDEKPAIYVYQQNYVHPFTGEHKMIRGFIARVLLQEYEKRVILPHEDVLSKPLQDRFNLTVATNTQFEPIYGLYHDRKNVIDNILDEVVNRNEPLIDYKEAENLIHKLWKIEDQKYIEIIEKEFYNKLIYIADGHHRYQTMLKYRDYYRKKKGFPNYVFHPVDFIMMFLVNVDHQGITILPTHRLLYNLKEMKLKSLLKYVQKYFQVEIYSFNRSNEKEVRERWLSDLRKFHNDVHTFGVYIKNLNHYFLLKLTNVDAYIKFNGVKNSEDWKKLDVNIIHTLLIDHILHIHKKDISNQIYIDYTKDHNKAIEGVKRGKYQVALILNPTKVREVIKIANNGEKMPQKSTYFYPKILSGMTIYKMN